VIFCTFVKSPETSAVPLKGYPNIRWVSFNLWASSQISAITEEVALITVVTPEALTEKEPFSLGTLYLFIFISFQLVLLPAYSA